uniref:Putative secreted protein n=1 Tax=Anopheles marajoara TaxID=58244 RepID=A0A2M4C6E2_9DIPT
MRSISSGVRRFWSLVMTIFSRLPVPLSSADTCRIPLASISNETSICGIPRGAGGMPVRSNLPSRWLSLVIGRSPSYTWIVTVCWLSEAVEKICDFFVGMTVLRGISLVITPPTVSIPMVSGFTSSSTMASVFSSPDSTPAWTAAP